MRRLRTLSIPLLTGLTLLSLSACGTDGTTSLDSVAVIDSASSVTSDADTAAAAAATTDDAATTAGQHYTLSFYVAGDAESNPTSLSVSWDGVQILAVSNASPGFTQYTFDVVGDASDPTTQLLFDFSGSGVQFVDQISISPTPGRKARISPGCTTSWSRIAISASWKW